MQLYCGIDLYSNNSMVSLIDDSDKLISEKHLANDLSTITTHLQPYANDITGIVIESTYQIARARAWLHFDLHIQVARVFDDDVNGRKYTVSEHIPVLFAH